ncbi:Bromodomain associated domain containing protein [Trema orientale]|uniref:Bromodomain associated domain containing protein n=1 Tax=Trema orientale TaxID=63057 RepID=A0A2P5FV96_TREOI|nr:Bromodomain associated domain containing protein [Trema orientale]
MNKLLGMKVNGQEALPGRLGADDFGRAVSKVAVAQICESVGFQKSKESALDALADITIRNLCDLGKTANFYANLTGRTECNVFDIISFRSFGSITRFSKSSKCELLSSKVRRG